MEWPVTRPPTGPTDRRIEMEKDLYEKLAAADQAETDIRKEATSLERVLVVPPNMGIRAALSEALEDEGYRLRAAASADDAWRVVRAETPDAAIVDFAEDHAALADVAARIRAAAFPRRVPILALTLEE